MGATGRAATYVSPDVTKVMPGDAGTVTAHAVTELDRAALGVRAPRFLIGWRIAVVIDAMFAPPSARTLKRRNARCGEIERRSLSVN